ncbi:hypothetical protein ACFO25_10140 [Paenactinomyces guangxiensis]|uniref:Uncharacterized protein n=1 Tax=Paenactinomyces guangxiensis TaxID=1490290 RepID=A0A7W1WSA1_9BACL|nr:hypothetical protein [Paenactinomyces guangxiensis]MBA4495144.1 hypothetical protein [Paenactinomyces guangxiensis]MBH8592172.1 hypothetical protein [Paenactinomyces guangxiensis]
MKAQANVTVISLFVTLFVLFGSFFGYQWWFVKKPLESVIKSSPHVTLKQMKVQPAEVKIVLKADPEFKLVSDYDPLRKKLKQISGNRNLELQVMDDPGPELKNAWNEMVFGVEEGIAGKQYTKIPQTVAKVAKDRQIGYKTKMDDDFIYIELYKKDRFMYQVLPLHKIEGGVKTNG